MRKVIIFFLGLFCYYGSIGQGIVNRSSQTMTVQDARWMAQFNMFAPRVVDTTAANFTKGIDSCGAIIFTYTDNGVWYRGCSPKRWLRMGSGQVLNDTIYTEIPIAVRRDSTGHQIIYFLKERGLISGGVVTLDSCMTLGLNPTVFNIGYKQYSIPAQSGLVVPPADPSNGRIDLIVIDTNLNFIDIPGTPSPTPIAPPYNIFSQFVLTQINVPQAATCLMIGQGIIYDQNKNTEWVVTTNGNITIDTANTANPYHLTKAIYVSQYHNGSSIIFTKGSTDTVTAGEIIKMFPYFNGAFTNQMSGQWYHGSTAVSNSISLNQFFNPNDSNRYLNLSAQLSSWIFSSPIFDKFIITFGGSDTTLTKGLYLDYIQLQKGISNIVTGDFVDSVKTSGDSLFYYKQGLAIYGGAVGGGSGGGINIYNTDSLLSGPRTVGLNSFPLDFTDGNGTDFRVSPSDGAMEFTSPLGKQLRVSDDANFLTLSYDTNSHLDMVSGKSTLTGNLFLNTVSSGASTDSILTINTSAGEVRKRSASSLGGSQTLQQVFDVQSGNAILNKDDTVSISRHNFLLGEYFGGLINGLQITDSSASGSGAESIIGSAYSSSGNLGHFQTSSNADGSNFEIVATNQEGGFHTVNIFGSANSTDPTSITYSADNQIFNGLIKDGSYGAGVVTGTPTFCSAWDASGNLIEVPCSSGGIPSIYNIGAGFRLVKPIDTVKTLFNKYGLILDSSSNTNGISFTVDSSLLLTKLRATSLYQPIGTYVTSVSGTSNRITSTGGTTPVIDISASYVGQSSITTLGTVTTGTLSTGAVIGGVTMTLGSDAQGDIYYRNGSGILTRLATGTTKQNLHPDGLGGYSWKDSTAASTGTVTSVATGLGLSGGTITTTGTLVVDTSSASILSRQRAAKTYWSLTGNTLLSRTTNYIGSSDTSQVNIDTKGVSAINIDSLQKVTISTQVIYPVGSKTIPSIAFISSTNTGFYSRGGGAIDWVSGGNVLMENVGSSKFQFGVPFAWASGPPDLNAPDVGLARAAAGVLRIYDGATVTTSGKLRILVLDVGTATANTAPLQFTAGIVETTPRSGLVETNSTNDLFYTNSGAVRAQVGMWSYIAKTASYTATNSDFTVDFTSNTDTLTLPTATGITGRVYIVINSTAASICVVQSTGSQVIGNGGILTSQNIPVGSSMTLQSTGTAWRIE